MNHVYRVVHNKTLEDLQQRKDGTALSIGKRGRPSRTSVCSSQSSQTGLHTFSSILKVRFSPMKGCLFVHELVGI